LSAQISDLDRNWWALVCLADASMNADLAAMPAVLQQLYEIAARVQCPRLAIMAFEHEGHAHLRTSPPNFAAGIASYEHAAQIARATGDQQSIGLSLRAIAMASTGLDAPDALARCHDALQRLFEVRHWQKIWQILDSVALSLARAGRTTQAAVVLGFLDARTPGYDMEHGLRFREQARRLVDAAGGHDEAKRLGASMSAETLILEALDYCSRQMGPTEPTRARS
jgi:hypothetical protein